MKHMDELSKGLDISIPAESRVEVLARFLSQIGEWGIALPPVEPLVLDFGLGRFDEIGLIEYWIANEVDAGYCGKYLFVFDGQTCPMHYHREKMETFFVVKGQVRMTLDGEELTMGSGSAS